MARRPSPSRPTARRPRRGTATPARAAGPGLAGRDLAAAVARSRAEALVELERLYAALPDLACKGLCGHSCAQHVDASTVERDRLVRVHGLDLDARTSDGACPALTRTLGATGSCTVHPHRPMICRLWGIAASMPCPHGCTPTGGHLTDTDTLRRLLASLETGGHPYTGTRRLLEQCMADPTPPPSWQPCSAGTPPPPQPSTPTSPPTNPRPPPNGAAPELEVHRPRQGSKSPCRAKLGQPARDRCPGRPAGVPYTAAWSAGTTGTPASPGGGGPRLLARTSATQPGPAAPGPRPTRPAAPRCLAPGERHRLPELPRPARAPGGGRRPSTA